MIKKYNRASVIVFAIATIMVIATVLLGYTGVAKVVRQVDNLFLPVYFLQAREGGANTF